MANSDIIHWYYDINAKYLGKVSFKVNFRIEWPFQVKMLIISSPYKFEKWMIYFKFCAIKAEMLTLLRMGFLRGCSRMGERPKRTPLPKIFQTYPTMMKLGTVIPYQNKFQKLYESPDTPFKFWWHQHFLTWNQQILLYQGIQI